MKRLLKKFSDRFICEARPGTALAVVIAATIVLLSLVANASAGPLNLFRASESINRAGEPFGLLTSTLSEGGLTEKWRGVEGKLDAELLALNLCEDSRTRCPSQAALQFLAIVDNAKARDKRARLGEINRAFNLAIKAENDLALYGEEDVWSPPLASLAIGAGDCEHYAIAKFVALGNSGVSAEDLRPW